MHFATVFIKTLLQTYQLTKEVFRIIKNSVKTKIRLNTHTHTQTNYYNPPPMHSNSVITLYKLKQCTSFIILQSFDGKPKCEEAYLIPPEGVALEW